MYDALITLLVTVQFIIAMLFCPLKIGAAGHVSLARDKIDLNVTVLGLSVAKVRVKRENGKFKLLVNGKQFKPKKKMSLNQIKNIGKQYKVEELKLRGNLLALVGTQDAKNTALLCAGIYGVLAPMMQGISVYTSLASDTFEIDGRVKIKINVLQIVSLAVAGLRGSNG